MSCKLIDGYRATLLDGIVTLDRKPHLVEEYDLNRFMYTGVDFERLVYMNEFDLNKAKQLFIDHGYQVVA